MVSKAAEPFLRACVRGSVAIKAEDRRSASAGGQKLLHDPKEFYESREAAFLRIVAIKRGASASAWMRRGVGVTRGQSKGDR